MRPHVLQHLVEPRAIALVCDQLQEDSAAALALERLQSGGFTGEYLLVCPGEKESAKAAQVPCFETLAEVGQRVDLAVMVLPTSQVPEQLRQCGDHGCKAAILLSHDDGEREKRRPGLAEEIRDVTRTYGIALLGPDSLGVIRPSLGLNATIAHSLVAQGSVALLAQSVGFSSALLDWAEANDFGFSLVATPGGALGVNFGDLLDFLSVDSQTRSVLVYLEQVTDARVFLSGLRTTARVKPVIVLKSGRDESADSSALAVDRVFDAAVARAGAVRVNTVHQLFTAARALRAGIRTRGQNIAILSNAKGPAVMAADRAARRGLSLTGPSAASLARICARRSGARAIGPTVDLLGDARPDDYGFSAEILLEDSTCDALLVLLTPQRRTDPMGCARALIDAAASTKKPVLACWMGQGLVADAREALSTAGILEFSSPERCVDAFTYLAAHERHQEVLLQAPPPQSGDAPADVAGARLIVEEAIGGRRSRLTESESKALLSAFRIPVQHSINANSPGDALVAAETLGMPVSLHINTPDAMPVGVALPRRDVRDATAIRGAYREVLEEMQQRFPDGRISGVGVQRLRETRERRELMVGIEIDDAFGPVILLGPRYGGHTPDPAVSMPPLNLFLCGDLIRQASRRFPDLIRDEQEARGLTDLLMRLSEICCELPALRRLAISPLQLGDGGVCAEHVEIEVAPGRPSTRRYGHMAIHPYPSDMLRHWQLPDGRDVTTRPIRPEDAEMERSFVDGLSKESRYNRFMYNMGKITPKMLARFTQVDYDREMALTVVLREEGADARILAVARYVANPDGQSCEFALTVADDMQRQGVGRQLMQSLMNAGRDRGLEIMEGEVLASNRKMLSLCESLGFRLVSSREDPEVIAVRRHLLER